MKPTPDQHLYDIINQRMEETLRAGLPHLKQHESGRTQCLATDPHRGVSCALVLGHSGDHQSVAGFPWENEHNPRPKYQGASPEDLAAVEELLAVPPPDPIHEDRCDDCGMKWPAHNTSVEH